MKTEDQYLRFVRWNEEDNLYVGYCPDLFPWGGVCHGQSEETTYHELCVLVREEVEQLRRESKELPVPGTRPMQEAVLAWKWMICNVFKNQDAWPATPA